MTSKVFLYRRDGARFKLYVGNISASAGLLAFPSETTVSIESYGATDRKGDGWITKSDLPSIGTVGELRKFLESPECYFVDLEAKIGGSATFSSYEDAECEYGFASQPEVLAVITALTPADSIEALTSTLLGNPDVYVEREANGQLRKYPSFDAYIASRRI